MKFKSLVSLYILADGLADPVTANMVIDTIKQFGQDGKQDRTPGTEVLELAFRSTREDDKLCCLLVDFYIFNQAAKYKEGGDYPKAFLDLTLKRFLHWKDTGGVTIDIELHEEVRGDRHWTRDEYHQSSEEDDRETERDIREMDRYNPDRFDIGRHYQDRFNLNRHNQDRFHPDYYFNPEAEIARHQVNNTTFRRQRTPPAVQALANPDQPNE